MSDFRDFVVHDKRLWGNTPTGDFETMEVDQNTPLTEMVARALAVSSQYGGIGKLKIMGHGKADDNDEDGYGLQFCAEDLDLYSVDKLTPLRARGAVQRIYLYGCGAAHIAKGRDGQHGDGKEFCRRLAMYSGAWVKAGDAVQTYVPRFSPWHWMEIDFGSWEGHVYWFSPGGTVVLNASNDDDE